MTARPPHMMLCSTLWSRSFSLPWPLAKQSKTMSSMSPFCVYLASIYHSLLMNATKTAKKKSTGRPTLRGIFVYGRMVAPSFRNVLTYASTTWWTGKKTHEKELERVQRRALQKHQYPKTLECMHRVIHRLFGNLVNNPDLQSSTFPLSYDVATHTPPPYSAIDIQAQNNIDMVDMVKPTPQYNTEYAPLEDVRMAGFLHSELATIFKEDEYEAVE
ncbi:hypothetical protein IW261DRAFT_1419596 [Armillaria novae-zelandiae]|uniref:Uncharacterized protein n=1 Tax=Armillaria novae-zelandiae TaxID=153914 RepID=A0AA39UAP6_9AGAR|nr:hypothetical protein IW261DRAFT_1419596 [Armillaria novae-zelandiae]